MHLCLSWPKVFKRLSNRPLLFIRNVNFTRYPRIIFIHSYWTRNANTGLFWLTCPLTNTMKKIALYRAASLWSTLCIYIWNISGKIGFRRHVKSILPAYYSVILYIRHFFYFGTLLLMFICCHLWDVWSNLCCFLWIVSIWVCDKFY